MLHWLPPLIVVVLFDSFVVRLTEDPEFIGLAIAILTGLWLALMMIWALVIYAAWVLLEFIALLVTPIDPPPAGHITCFDRSEISDTGIVHQTV